MLFKNNDSVVVDAAYSGWEWEGTIVGFHEDYCCVLDQEDNVFDVPETLLYLAD